MPSTTTPAQDSIVDRLIAAADRPTGVRFVGPSVVPAEGDPFVSWAQIHDDARVVGAALQARGLVPGDHVAILGPTSRPLITIIQGCWLAGIASMVLPAADADGVARRVRREHPRRASATATPS